MNYFDEIRKLDNKYFGAMYDAFNKPYEDLNNERLSDVLAALHERMNINFEHVNNFLSINSPIAKVHDSIQKDIIEVCEDLLHLQKVLEETIYKFSIDEEYLDGLLACNNYYANIDNDADESLVKPVVIRIHKAVFTIDNPAAYEKEEEVIIEKRKPDHLDALAEQLVDYIPSGYIHSVEMGESGPWELASDFIFTDLNTMNEELSLAEGLVDEISYRYDGDFKISYDYYRELLKAYKAVAAIDENLDPYQIIPYFLNNFFVGEEIVDLSVMGDYYERIYDDYEYDEEMVVVFTNLYDNNLEKLHVAMKDLIEEHAILSVINRLGLNLIFEDKELPSIKYYDENGSISHLVIDTDYKVYTYEI